MKKILKSLLKYGLPVIIGVALIWLLLDNVDINAMNDVMKAANFWWFGIVVVISTLSHVFRAMRWRLQLRAIGIEAPLSALVNSIFGTYAVNLVFPRAGEVWRCGYIANREKASFTKVVGSMVADRMTDTVTVLLITLAAVVLAKDAIYDRLGESTKAMVMGMVTNVWMWVALAVMAALIVWLFASKTQNALVLKIRTMVLNLWNGFAAIGKMQGKWMFVFYTFCIWGCYYLQLYFATFAFSFTSDLGVVPVLVLFVLSSIGMGVPTNGGLGAWHMAIILGLSIYGIGTFNVDNLDPNASGFAMLVWGIQTLLLIVLGIYAYVSMEIDRRKIASGERIVLTQSDRMQL
ncbi:MAG: lysylphosphatidylglycerol synthase transmembrane domain-containing protein [Muribaculaceae bacterium]